MMKPPPTHRQISAPARRVWGNACGFSLVEVIVAIGIAGGATVILLALLSSLLRTAEDNADLQTALRLCGAIEARLYEEMGGSFPGALGAAPAGRVYAADKAGTHLRDDEVESLPLLLPPYFHIEVKSFATPPLAYQAGRGVLPLQVRISWPYAAVTAGAGQSNNARSADFVLSLTPP